MVIAAYAEEKIRKGERGRWCQAQNTKCVMRPSVTKSGGDIGGNLSVGCKGKKLRETISGNLEKLSVGPGGEGVITNERERRGKPG